MKPRGGPIIAGLLALLALFVISCGEKVTTCQGTDCGEGDPPISPDVVLKNLQVAYKTREIRSYSRHLAADFRFHVDADTRQRIGLPEFWLHDEDSLRTQHLFESPDVSDIRIKLTYGTPRPAMEVGKEGWVYIDVLDTFLEVDLVPSSKYPEGVTLRVDGQQQRFFFRKGRTPADPDSVNWYITEWRDYGFGNSAPGPATEGTTWSAVKSYGS